MQSSLAGIELDKQTILWRDDERNSSKQAVSAVLLNSMHNCIIFGFSSKPCRLELIVSCVYACASDCINIYTQSKVVTEIMNRFLQVQHCFINEA